MSTPTTEFADISRLVKPRRVAVVGASDRIGSFGNSTFTNVHKNSDIEFGAVPVNPGYDTVLGEKCYDKVSEITGEPIDVVIVLVAAELVRDVVDDCATVGVKHLLVLTSGFSETDDAGKLLQEQVVEAAAAANMRVYGPNSPGLANIADRALLSMSPVANDDTTSGPVGLVTQGGGLGRAIMQWMDRGLGIGLWCSPGNEADLDIADFINHMVGDDRIKVIGAVVEGFSAGPKFLQVAERAREAGKPIVILKIGRSEYGQKSAASHTASIAGNDAVTSAVFSQYGVVRVDDVDELGETLMLFSRALDTDADIGSTCVYSFSGGTASLAADLVGAAGLELAEFSAETKRAIGERAPAFGFADNPVDLTTKVFTDPDLNEAVLSLICADPSVGSLLFAMPADYGINSIDVTAAAIDICARYQTLLIPVWMSPRRGEGYGLLEAEGMAPFSSTQSAVTAMTRLVQWRDCVTQADRTSLTGDESHGAAPDSTALAYEDAARLLAPAGIRFPQESFATDAESAGTAAERIGGPVAVKLSAPGLVHKTEVGGVRLGVEGREGTTSVVAEMIRPERLAPFGFVAAGVFVQEMIGDGVDLLLSAHDDEVFGPVVTLGAGGIATELEKDVLHLAIPFSRAQFFKALEGLRVHKRLVGFRGSDPYDLEKIFDAAQALGDRYVQLTDVAEIEINPLRVVHEGTMTDTIALDAVVFRA